MQLLQDTLTDDAFLLDLDADSFELVVRKALDHLVSRDIVSPNHRPMVEEAIRDREKIVSTAIGNSVAIPHAYLDIIEKPSIVFIRLAHSQNMGAPDGIPTKFFFLLLGPKEHAAEHLDALTEIARLMSDDEFRYDAGRAHSRNDLIDALKSFDRRTRERATKPKRDISPELEPTGRLFGGMVQDLKRRLPKYKSDFVDGLNAKCLGTVFFLFFACIAPAITFGGIMGGAVTDGHIGVVEMLIATAVCGIIYSLVAGQPLIILGGVGPLLVFTGILYQLCLEWELDFLPAYCWVGIWTSLILLILAATDASSVMRYFTRFTDDIFSALMSIIFIVEATNAIILIFQNSFTNDTTNHDKAFLSLILALGTFFVAMNLSRFRKSKYLLPWMREFLSDFGPSIAIVAMTVVAFLFRKEVFLDLLSAPETIRPTLIVDEATNQARDWFVNPLDAPRWVWFASIIPAILTSILVFLVQNITARLINSPDMKLEKGASYHWDLGVVGFLIGGCSFFGLPWFVAATVRSIAHVRGLATHEEVVKEGKETHERILHVHENRITALTIHVLIGLSLFALTYLKVTPMAVLYGLFLYMGIASISGNQFLERFNLWLMDSSLYPQTHYIRRMPILKIHVFTLIQLVCLVALCWISYSSNGILRITFPLFIVLLVPIRSLIAYYFTPEELAALDAENEPDDEETHWAG